MRFLAALLLVLLAGCERPVPEGVTELTYASPYPPGHPFSRADIRWMDYVEQASGGTLQIRPVWSGALLSADMSMEEIRHGVADIGLITPIYARGGAHLLRTQTGFYSGADTQDAQLEFYRCMVAQVPQFARELDGLKVLAVQGGPLPGILVRGREVDSLDDLDGLRIRAPSELLPVLHSFGADPVDMPMGEVYSALAKGVIDGVVASRDTLRSMHFVEVTDHFYEIRIARGAYPARAIDQDVFDALSPAHQSVIEDSVAVWEDAIKAENLAAAEAGTTAGEGVITVSPASEPDQNEFDAVYLRMAEERAEALSRYGIDGTDAFRKARASLVARNQIECGV